VVLPVAFNQGVFAVREDAFRFIVLAGGGGIVDDFLGDQVNPADICALVAISAERQLALFGRTEILRLHRA
jgi:hypothetical protein